LTRTNNIQVQYYTWPLGGLGLWGCKALPLIGIGILYRVNLPYLQF